MKIAVVYLADYPPSKGASGGDRRVRDIARGIAAQGHEVYMAVPRRDETRVSREVDGLHVTYLGKPGGGPLGQLINRLSFWSGLQKFAVREKIDWILLYNVDFDAFFVGRWLRRKGIRLAAEFCDMYSAAIKRTSLAGLAGWSRARLNEMLVPKATALNIVISRFLKAYTEKRAPKTPCLLLPVLVDSELFRSNENAVVKAEERWGIKESDVLFAYVGGLWKQEGVGSLIEAFADIIRRFPRARLIVAGRLVKASTHDDIEDLIEKYELYDSVVTPGWVSTEDVVTIYSRADVLVLPQINDRCTVAALPTKSAEYALMGKAIIATKVGDIPIYFHDDDDALLVESENVSALAMAMERLIEDPTLRHRLATGAHKVAEAHFDYRQAGRRIVEAMKETIIRD